MPNKAVNSNTMKYQLSLILDNKVEDIAVNLNKTPITKNSNGKFCCRFCDKTFTQGASLKRHKLQHEERKEKCGTCGKKFHDKYDMMKHEKTHATSVVMFIPYETPCNICSMTFASIAKIKQHNEYHHPDSKITYKKPKMVFACTNCGKILKDGYQLKLHLSRHDKKENYMKEKKKEEEIKIVNTCCSYEGKAPHRCDQCQKCFTRSKFLLKHMRQSSKHGAKRPIFKRDKICNICEAQFHSHSTLKQHQITHTGEKLFACPTCDKKFSQSGTLLRHKRSHTGEKNHQCLECGKAYGQKGELIKHNQRIHGETNWTTKTTTTIPILSRKTTTTIRKEFY